MIATPKKIGCRHLLRRGQHDGHRIFLRLPSAHASKDVFNHDHRAIDNEAEVDRPETHKVAGDTSLDHAGKGRQHGQGDCERDNEAASKAAEQEQEDRDNEKSSLDQISADGLDRASDKVSTVIEGLGADASRKIF